MKRFHKKLRQCKQETFMSPWFFCSHIHPSLSHALFFDYVNVMVVKQRIIKEDWQLLLPQACDIICNYIISYPVVFMIYWSLASFTQVPFPSRSGYLH